MVRHIILAWVCCLVWTTQALAVPSLINTRVAVGPLKVYDAAAPFDQTQFAEATVAVIPPAENGSCTGGRIFVQSDNQVGATDLDGAPVMAPAGLPFVGMLGAIYDNQIVEQPDASLVASVETINDAPLPQTDVTPPWWDETIEYVGKSQYSDPGVRGKISLSKSTDCGKTWTEMPGVDAATLVVPDPATGMNTPGLCGTPRMNDNPSHTPEKWSELGGPDGHSLYSDPYTGALYASTACTYGVVGQVNTPTHSVPDQNNGTALIFTGTDWKVIGNLPNGYLWREAWTSFSSGAATFVYWSFSPTVQSTNFPSADLALAKLSPALHNDLSKGAVITSYGAPFAARTVPISQALNVTGYITAARSEGMTPNILISVPTLSADGATTTDTIYAAPVLADGALGQAALIDVFPPAEKGGQVYHGTLIEGPKGWDVQLYYWLDDGPSGTFTVRYALLSNHGEVNAVGVLSQKDGKPYSWDWNVNACPNSASSPPLIPCFLGDYMHGTSYYDLQSKSVVFVATWEETVLRASSVRGAAPLLVNAAAVRISKVVVPVGLTIVPAPLKGPKNCPESPKTVALEEQLAIAIRQSPPDLTAIEGLQQAITQSEASQKACFASP